MSCYIFDTKMEDCETLRSPEGEETGNSRQDIFYPPNPSSVCSLFFKKPFKSHMGKEALQGAFDSFWFWLRQWNYWENPTFYRILLLKGLLSGLKTIKSLFVGQYRAEEKIKIITEQERIQWVCTELHSSVRMWHQRLRLPRSLSSSYVTRWCIKATARSSSSLRVLETDHAPPFSNHLPLALTFHIMQVNSLRLVITPQWCTGLTLASLNSDYSASAGRPRNARIIQSLNTDTW